MWRKPPGEDSSERWLDGQECVQLPVTGLYQGGTSRNIDRDRHQGRLTLVVRNAKLYQIINDALIVFNSQHMGSLYLYSIQPRMQGRLSKSARLPPVGQRPVLFFRNHSSSKFNADFGTISRGIGSLFAMGRRGGYLPNRVSATSERQLADHHTSRDEGSLAQCIQLLRISRSLCCSINNSIG